jgi:uncharacterized protein YodC (DUF2158 family)
MFKKGDVVKLKAVVPSGPIQAMRMSEEGEVYCMLQWVDADGVTQTRWFLQSDLVLA